MLFTTKNCRNFTIAADEYTYNWKDLFYAPVTKLTTFSDLDLALPVIHVAYTSNLVAIRADHRAIITHSLKNTSASPGKHQLYCVGLVGFSTSKRFCFTYCWPATFSRMAVGVFVHTTHRTCTCTRAYKYACTYTHSPHTHTPADPAEMIL